jgi:hypothetical protein
MTCLIIFVDKEAVAEWSAAALINGLCLVKKLRRARFEA